MRRASRSSAQFHFGTRFGFHSECELRSRLPREFLSSPQPRQAKLGAMQSASTDLSSIAAPSGATSFAGVLASAADSAWSLDGLADDVATLSYEEALRSHSAIPDSAPDQGSTERPAGEGIGHPPQPSVQPRPLKTASITIRLSEPDCQQVRQRAAEAGLTVSEYLRSCTLEVDSLRAQVKDALAQIRTSAGSAASFEAPARERNHRLGTVLARVQGWFRRFPSKRRLQVRINPANPFAPVQNWVPRSRC
jgi:hypothetical protein